MFESRLIKQHLRLPTQPLDAGDNHHELSRLWWLLVPLAFFVLRYAVSLFTHPKQGLESWFRGEQGLIENLTVVLLFCAMTGALYILNRHARYLHLLPKIFLAFYSIGCLYFLGEEASWGQHWFGWETGDYFRSVNDQQETNFHNTSRLLDRVPKSIVSLAVFIGGIVIPLYLRRKSLKIDCSKPMWWLFPTWVCLPTAVLVTVATWPAKIERSTGWDFYFTQAQEIKELYIAYFFLLFIVSLGLRLHVMRATGQQFSAR
jgi:lysylphosphatidylglycerol synthetase-like protein (DUF2156 family)